MIDNISNISDEIDNLTLASSHVCTPDQCTEIVNNSGSNFKVIHVNIRSINKNLDQFISMLSMTKLEYDIIILSECWLKRLGPPPSLSNYSSHATIKNHTQNEGVVMYIRYGLGCTINEPPFVDANCLVATVGNTAVVGLYRPPSHLDPTQFYSSLDTLMTTLKSYKNIVMMGDLNIDIKSNNTDRNASDYLLCTASLGLLPAHIYPTRLGNCLDHIFLKTRLTATAIILDTHITDHLPIILCLKLNEKLYVNKNKKVITQLDFGSIKKDIDKLNFSSVTEEADANIAADNLIAIIRDVVIKHTTKKKVTRRTRILKPWISAGLLRCIQNRDRMHLKLREHPNDTILLITYKRYRNFCNSLLKKLKCEYEKEQYSKAQNSPKAMWEVINSISGRKRQSQPATELMNLTADAKVSTNSVNKYFVNIGKDLASKLIPPGTVPSIQSTLDMAPQCNSLGIIPVTQEQVAAIIASLRSNCATGWDNIPALVIKQSQNVLVAPITHVCNISITTGVFPNSFKKAIVTPVFKGGNRNHVTNYRPISVLSALSKILERILSDCLTKYLTKYNIISKNQYGFRSGMSTEDAVINFSKSVVHKLDNSFKCYGIFLDLSKAFDTVSVPILISKLESIGIRGLPLDIFKDYLFNRSQAVKIDTVVSEEEQIGHGVPQGSILGPTLFLIYVNDLCNMKLQTCDIFTYADDTALLVYGRDWLETRTRAENYLREVMLWLSSNLLTLNIEKTKYVRFYLPHSPKPPVETLSLTAHSCVTSLSSKCSCLPLTNVGNIRYLGVLLDERMDWRPQVEALTGRVRRLIYVFKNLRYSADKSVMCAVYKALCQSILGYCITAWGGTYKTLLLQLERAQRYLLKVMHCKPRDYPTAKLYSDSEVLTVRQLFILRAMLRRHSEIPLSARILQKRHGTLVCPTVQCKTALASRNYNALSSRLYNSINKQISFYKLSKHNAKDKLENWLKSLCYEETEKLLVIVK